MAIQFQNHFESQKELSDIDNQVLGILVTCESCDKMQVAEMLKLDVNVAGNELRKLWLLGHVDRSTMIDIDGILEYRYSIKKISSDQTNLFDNKKSSKVE